jgi:hypothetical protein
MVQSYNFASPSLSGIDGGMVGHFTQGEPSCLSQLLPCRSCCAVLSSVVLRCAELGSYGASSAVMCCAV